MPESGASDAGGPAAELGRGRHALRLEVVERNGDEVIVEGRVSVRHFRAAAACNVSLAALAEWRSRIAAVQDSLAGRAALEDSRFVVTIEADGRGGVLVEGVFDSETGWGDGERAVLRFTLPPLDQTDLTSVLAMLDAAAAMPPYDDGCAAGTR